MKFARGDEFGGVAADDGPGFDVSDGYSAGGDDGTLADGDVWSDEGAGANPGVGIDLNRGREQGQRGVGVVVGAGTEVGFLGDHDAGAEGDGAQAVEADLVADDAQFADAEIPWVIGADGPVYPAVGADLRTEEAEEETAPGVKGMKG